jgi:hypothetical protein
MEWFPGCRQTFPYQIMEELPVIRPGSMPSAEITSYNPAYQALAYLVERLLQRAASKNLRMTSLATEA